MFRRPSFCRFVIAFIGFFFWILTDNRLFADEKSDRAWYTGWNEQKSLLTLPKGLTERQLMNIRDKFGADMPNREHVREQFIDRLVEEYKSLFESLAPLAARDDWSKTLRLPPAARQVPTSEEVWLMLEDLWVQREVLATINRVNMAAAQFKQMKREGIDNPKQRLFRSPLWEADLKIVEKGNKASLTGSLKNVSERLQHLGARNSLKLQVWFSADGVPFEFVVEGGSVEAGKTLAIKPMDNHIIPLGLRVTEIARVEQVFDLRTVPIKRVEQLVLGKTGERQQREPLVMSRFSAVNAAKEDAKDNTPTQTGIERKRYLQVTDEMRRMPFGVAVVADQAFMKDLLEEFGRSKLLMQITQSEFSRFRGVLNTEVPARPLGPMGPVGPMGPIGPIGPKADAPANNRDDSNAPGLVEVSIYGIATLYERYPIDKPPPKARPDDNKKPTAHIDNSWLHLYEYINHSLPMPGPNGNLLGADQRKFWNVAEGKQDGRLAAEKFFARQRQGLDPRIAYADDDMRESLAAVDIEAVHCRHTDDLKAFYDNAADYQKKYVSAEAVDIFDTMGEFDRKKLPKGGGWVFEIRGTTWYDVGTLKAKELVKRTLLANLQRLANDGQTPPDIKGKISHIFLYNTWVDRDPRPDFFHFIQASLVDVLMPAQEGRPKEGVEGGPFRSTGIIPKEGAPTGVIPTKTAKTRPRYEFVIHFVWKEPAPEVALKTAREITKAWAPFFDAIGPADPRRVNPSVLPITEIQADFMYAKIPAVDILDDRDKRTIGVLRAAVPKDDPVGKKLPDLLKKQRQMPMPRPPMGLPMGGPIGFERPRNDLEPAARSGIDYVPLEPDQLEGKRFAITIYPQRMVVLQAAFPYKEQIAEIARALRLKDVPDVFKETSFRFRGVVIERRVGFSDGKVDDWQPLKFEEHYRNTIHPRSLGDHEDAPELRYVTLPFENELFMPLPDLSMLRGKYPDVRLPSVLRSIEKLREKGKPPEARALPQGDAMPDHILVRIVDNDVLPGRQYQYRLKVRLQNPNWAGAKPDPAKFDLVAQRQDAAVEIIEGSFVEMKTPIRIPDESYHYVIDPPPADLREPRNTVRLRPGEAFMQLQRWLPYAQVGFSKEAVGDWIVADIVARRGTYLGGPQLVPLPTWSSEFNRYLMPENPKAKPREPKRGLVMDPTKPGPNLIVVDVFGGQQEIRDRFRRVEDESATEVLLLDEDGTLQVRSSRQDRANPDRLKREETWHKWIEEVEKATNAQSGFEFKKKFD